MWPFAVITATTCSWQLWQYCGTGCMLFLRLFHGVILRLLQCQTPSSTHAHTFSTGICTIQMLFVIFLIIPFDFCILLFFCKSLSLFSFFIVGSKYFTCQYIFVNYYAFQYILLVNYYAWAHVHASCVYLVIAVRPYFYFISVYFLPNPYFDVRGLFLSGNGIVVPSFTCV